MDTVNDEKPRIILTEHKVVEVISQKSSKQNSTFQILFQNLPQGPTVFDDQFDAKYFKKKLQIVVIRRNNTDMEFDLIGVQPFLANTFRRLMLSEVPTMAIDKVHILNNTSIIQDEVLAHRLGLIPIRADPRLFESVSEGKLCL